MAEAPVASTSSHTAPIIYTSSFPDVHLPRRSIFTHLLSLSTSADGKRTLVGGYDGESVVGIEPRSGVKVTRRKLRELSLKLAHGLRTTLRVTPRSSDGSISRPRLIRRGDTVLVYSPNSIVYPIIVLGAIAAGLKVTLANAAYTPAELRHQYEDARAVAVMAHPALARNVEAMFESMSVDPETYSPSVISCDSRWLLGQPGHDHVDLSASPPPAAWRDLGSFISSQELEREELFEGNQADETALMCYSSGTTGKPKGVETTHRNLTSMVEMYGSVIGDKMFESRTLSFLPLFHIYGAVVLLFLPLRYQATIYLMARFDLVDYLSFIQRYEIQSLPLVPPILLALAQHPIVAKYDLKSVEFITSGGAALPEPLTKAVTARMSKMGCANLVITQGYGLTETSPCTHMDPLYDAMKKPGSIGILLANVQARLVDVDTGIDVPLGSRGELWVRGPNVMKGYIGNPQATAACLNSQGWFATGDVAIRDEDGYFFIVDRKKELIKYKGFQVPPAELESVLLEHPRVADVGVIGIDDPSQATELPRAYVVPKQPALVLGSDNGAERAALEAEIAEWIKTRVAHHKYLRGGVRAIAEIPKSAAGKILRKDLRLLAKEEWSRMPARSKL